jgi:hypothetical protein
MPPRKGKFKVLPVNGKIKILQKEVKQLITGPYDCPNCTKTVLKIVISSKTKEIHATSISRSRLLQQVSGQVEEGARWIQAKMVFE